MDQERFDAITRTLASGISRRGVLRTLGGVSAGGVLAVVGRGTAAAKGRPCKNGGTPCNSGKHFQCCTCKQECKDGGSGLVECVVSRTVSLLFTSAGYGSTICRMTVSVTGFAGGSYEAYVDGNYFGNITVDNTTGTGNVMDGNNWGPGGTYEATVDGVCSGPTPLAC
jgi:hypothetical protein